LPALNTEEQVQNLLRELCARPQWHGRFLNTLSLLEHIGSRKILLSQRGGFSEDVLRHLAEETRHAHFFRKAAERAAKRSLGYEDKDMLAPAAARMYFGRLDAMATRNLDGSDELAYPYVTLLVELRALWLYRIYESVLRQERNTLTLRSVLIEEDAHLAAVEDRLSRTDARYAARRGELCLLEASLFSRWFEAVKTCMMRDRDD